MKNYRDFLVESLKRRVLVNPKYSLRAFARDLDISCGQLSLVMRARKGISLQKAEKIFTDLGVLNNEKKFYLLQIEEEHSRSLKSRSTASIKLRDSTIISQVKLTQNAFEIISDWQHFAILQVISLADFKKQKTRKSQLSFISSKLSLDVDEVTSAVDRLIEVNLIDPKKKSLISKQDTVLTTDDVPSAALRNFHSQILRKAISALETQTLEERYPNTIVLPILRKHYPKIRDEILNFQTQILKKYGRVDESDGECVYSLTQQLFNLTPEKK